MGRFVMRYLEMGCLVIGMFSDGMFCDETFRDGMFNPNQICIVPFGTLFSKTVFKH